MSLMRPGLERLLGDEVVRHLLDSVGSISHCHLAWVPLEGEPMLSADLARAVQQDPAVMAVVQTLVEGHHNRSHPLLVPHHHGPWIVLPVELNSHLEGYVMGTQAGRNGAGLVETITQELTLSGVRRLGSTEEALGHRLVSTLRLVRDCLQMTGSREFDIEDLSLEMASNYEEMHFLREISQNIGSLHDVDSLAEFVLQRSAEMLRAAAGIVLYRASGAWRIGGILGKVCRPRSELIDCLTAGLSNGSSRGSTIVNEPARKMGPGWPRRPPYLRPMLRGPMWWNDSLLGAVLLFRGDRRDVFTSVDQKLMDAVTSQAAATLHNLRLFSEQRRLKDCFGRYVSPQVVEEILHKPDAAAMLSGQRRYVTILFADVIGFTPLTERTEPRQLVSHLNEFLEAMGEEIFRFRGTIMTYLGDAIMALFGAPLEDDHHALHGLQAALAMQERMQQLRRAWKKRGMAALEIGIGVNTGDVILGDLGSSRRMEYAAIGDAANLAARLEKLNRTYHTRVMTTRETLEAAGPVVVARTRGEAQIKGKGEPVEVFEVLAAAEAPSASPPLAAIGLQRL